MPCKQDVYDEFFRILSAQRRVNQTGPALDEAAADDLVMYAGLFAHARGESLGSARMRRNAMQAAVAAMRVVLSLDDAIV